jgi:putative endonuclease
MEDFVLYILKSSVANKTYIGYSGNIIQRIFWHNNGNKGYTQKFRPWTVIHIEFSQTKSEAMKREKFLKSGQGRVWIKNNII